MYLEDFEKYKKLKIEDVPSISQNDLPDEFSPKSFKTVDEFIKKTRNLDYECVIYFDYYTGEILKCAFGDGSDVSIDFDDEFEDNHVASIHNHPANVFSPPSGKNFGILMRNFEDYELIAGFEYFWILKAKFVNMNLCMGLKIYAELLLDSCYDYCKNRYHDDEKVNEVCEIMYGVMLSNYINDKNINVIQLTKKEYNHDY